MKDKFRKKYNIDDLHIDQIAFLEFKRFFDTEPIYTNNIYKKVKQKGIIETPASLSPKNKIF